MSLKIIKAGILDTVQDTGRFGYQNAGINPGGAMDRFAAQLANALLGKRLNAAVIEMHFPAATIVFEKRTILCITGADFSPFINDVAIPVNQPVAVQKNEVLRFKKIQNGARCYLALLQDFNLPEWLDSYSTNLKAGAGGFEGRALQKDDVLHYPNIDAIGDILHQNKSTVLPYKATPFYETTTECISIITGNEWHWLTDAGKHIFATQTFAVSAIADRMGYRLQGAALALKEEQQLVSAAVGFGTLQLLPNGQLILLMADHQTTGGYPRIGHVVSAHLPFAAQMKPADSIRFKLADVATAEQQALQQHQYLTSVQYAAAFNIQKLLR